MQYIIVFLEGIITFVSPCLLPMLPVYISYFAGSGNEAKNRTPVNALGFVLGFTLVFIVLGAFAGTIGRFLKEHAVLFNIVTGSIVVLFGLNFLGVVKIHFPGGTGTSGKKAENMGFFHAILFGIVFSISWTPCVGAFLGSALMLAAQSGSTLSGISMLLLYSLGLGIPFVLSAVLIDKLKSTLGFIKRNYITINRISGIFLVLIGILMICGVMGSFLSLLTF